MDYDHNAAAKALDPSMFSGDLASRYGDSKAPPSVGPMPQQAASPATMDNLALSGERVLQDEIRAGDSTVTGYVDRFNSHHMTYLKSLLADERWDEAKEYYDSMQTTIDNNRQEILTAANVGGYGATGQRISQLATGILNGDYNQQEVVFRNGSKATVGQIFGDGGQFFRDKGSLSQSGVLDQPTADMYLKGSDAQRKALSYIVNPLIEADRNKRPAKNGYNARQLGNAFATRWDEITSVFGENGASTLAGYLSQATSDSGDGSKLLDSFLKYGGMRLASAEGYVSQEKFVNDVIGGHERMLTAVMRPDNSQGGTQAYIPSEEDRLTFDSMVLPAVSEAASRIGSNFDFDDPRTHQACREVADTLSWLKAGGIDLRNEAKRQGVDINGAFGKYIAATANGDRVDSGSLVRKVMMTRSMLSRMFRGGVDPVDMNFGLSGQVQDYKGSTSRFNGNGETSNPTADGIMAEVTRATMGALMPYVVSGDMPDTALTRAIRTPAVRNRLLANYEDTFAAFLSGPGRDEAARYLARTMVTTVIPDGGVQPFQEILGRLVLGAKDLSAQGRQSLMFMYGRDVKRQEQFADSRRVAQDNLVKLLKGDAFAVNRAMVKADTNSHLAMLQGTDPRAPYAAASRLVDCTVPVMKDGKQMVGEDGYPVYRRYAGDAMRMEPFDYGGVHVDGQLQSTNPALFDRIVKSIEEDRVRGDKRAAEAKKTSASNAKADARSWQAAAKMAAANGVQVNRNMSVDDIYRAVAASKSEGM